MKKYIAGAVYNTETAKKICEQNTDEIHKFEREKAKQSKQLYRTKSGKFFFYIIAELMAYVAVNDDDLNPEFEFMEVEDHKIVPTNYETAARFAGEVIAFDPEQSQAVGKFFPEVVQDDVNENKKIQKKIYISEKANWYLDMMISESEDTNSSFIEKLIVEQYRNLYEQGILQNDPYNEMENE